MSVYLLEECKAMAVALRIQAVRKRDMRLKRKWSANQNNQQNNASNNGEYGNTSIVQLGTHLALPTFLAVPFLEKQMRTDIAISGGI
jgi:hypothetical protein